jgi:hypothetical protein
MGKNPERVKTEVYLAKALLWPTPSIYKGYIW